MKYKVESMEKWTTFQTHFFLHLNFSIVLAFCLFLLIRFNRSFAFIFVNGAMEKKTSQPSNELYFETEQRMRAKFV